MLEVLSPVPGIIMSMDDVKDIVFSSRMLGDGVVIDPADDLVCSPCDGEILSIYPDGHAFVVQNNNEKIMVHIGLDTIDLNGQPFSVRRKIGDRVYAGDPIVDVDYDYLEQRGYLTDTIVLVVEKFHLENIDVKQSDQVDRGDLLFTV